MHQSGIKLSDAFITRKGSLLQLAPRLKSVPFPFPIIATIHILYEMSNKNDKIQAELIGSGILEAARDVIKTNLFDPLKSLEFVSVKPMRILAREVKV